MAKPPSTSSSSYSSLDPPGLTHHTKLLLQTTFLKASSPHRCSGAALLGTLGAASLLPIRHLPGWHLPAQPPELCPGLGSGSWSGTGHAGPAASTGSQPGGFSAAGTGWRGVVLSNLCPKTLGG